MIKRFFDQSIVVKRMKSAGGDKISFSSTATVDGHIQVVSDSTRPVDGILEERQYKAWFDEDADIQEQDTLVDESGIVYNVREINKKNYGFGINTHLEVILQEQN